MFGWFGAQDSAGHRRSPEALYPACRSAAWWPTTSVALDAAAPQSRARVGDLAPLPEIPADVVELVAIELEDAAGDLQRVDRLVGARRLEAVDDEAAVDLLDVECVAVVRADNVRFIQERMKNAAKSLIIVCLLRL
jgi:hypothetical protein